MRPLVYTQQAASFVPNLSMLDVLMHGPPAQVLQLLDACESVA